jgi:streptomycin 6-kinase
VAAWSWKWLRFQSGKALNRLLRQILFRPLDLHGVNRAQRHGRMDALAHGLANTIVNLYGTRGSEWLQRLPVLIAECERRWSIAVMAPLDCLTFNYVAPAVGADGQEMILKLGVVNPELLTEIEALRLFDGRGSVQLLAADPDQGALLLERLRPGTPLSTLADDERATSIAAGVMRQLWRPVPAGHPFPSVARWAAGLGRLRARFGGTTGPLPQTLVEQAEALFGELLSSMDELLLLHGDLHHDNILAAGRQPWLAVDPKGVVGEPAYEVGALLRNPWPRLLDLPRPGRILARRVDQLAEELELDRARIVAWGVAQAVLSAWWCLEDGYVGWEYAIRCAELLADLA